jgi:SsrA-binding protein
MAANRQGKTESDGTKLAVQNRRARHDYHLGDRVEAGMVLVGTEVKSLRAGQGSLAEAWVRIADGEAWLQQCHIPEYSHGNRNNHDPIRPRKLLLHKREIERLGAEAAREQALIVPTRIYFRDGRAKCEIAVAKSKNKADRRQDLKARDAKREMERALKDRSR